MEFLPILWHDELHSDTVTGLDKQLEQITLGSIPKLRQFTNDSLMDILFYTSSRYSQLIVNTVAREITRLRELFLSRNPNFSVSCCSFFLIFVKLLKVFVKMVWLLG